MTQQQWSAVDEYVNRSIVRPDAALDDALKASAAAGLPEINVTAAQGKFLSLLARSIKAKAILEIGTLGGYSTIWLARGIGAGGRVTTLEYEPKHAEMARKNLAHAGVADRVDVLLGRALDTLPTLNGPFDLIFIDADKASTADYFKWAIKLSHPGSVIIVDNVIRNGKIIDDRSADDGVLGIRRFNDALVKSNLSATTLQTVGAKGYDGFTMVVV